jgi:hypothetical protein
MGYFVVKKTQLQGQLANPMAHPRRLEGLKILTELMELTKFNFGVPNLTHTSVVELWKELLCMHWILITVYPSTYNVPNKIDREIS